MYEQPSAGHRIGPALIAFLVVVAAAAGTVGYYGTRRLLGGAITPSANGPTSPGQGVHTTFPNTSPHPGTPTTAPHGTPTVTATPATTYPPGDPTKCPAVTEAAVMAKGLAGGLQLLLYIEARRRGLKSAEVWVCQNTDGVLIYQGHRLSGPFDSAQSDHTLLLATGIRGDVVATADGYKATNPNGATDSTDYLVSRTKLVQVDQPAGTSVEYTVVNVYPT